VKLKPPAPIATTDYDALIGLWAVAGLPFRPQGRDSREAFAAQNAGGTQFAIGVWTEDGMLIGSLLATHDGRRGWINRLAVHPDYRRHGVAKQLIEAGEQALRDCGIDVIAALIEHDNDASLALFSDAGYVEHHGLHYVSKRSSADS
jgi:ribosomal protein S18 acetylase RimI-like enzyme